MIDDEPNDKIDMDHVDQAISDTHEKLMLMNSALQAKLRRKAHKMLEVAEQYAEMEMMADAIASMYVMQAQDLAEQAFELMTAEFDVQVDEDEFEEIPDDDEG